MGTFDLSKVVIKEYTVNGKIFRIYLPTEKQVHAISISNHNSNAHALNGNHEGVMLELVNSLTILLTPEGMDPAEEDREEVKKEVLALPYGFIIQLLGDLCAIKEGVKAT
jgi:hypothetical protein